MAVDTPGLPLPEGEATAKARRLAQKDKAVHATVLLVAGFSLVIVALIAVYVFQRAWPAFSANGFEFFTNQDDPNMDRELAWAFTGNPPGVEYTHLHAFPAIYATLLMTGGSIVLGVPFSILASIFVVELAPRRLGRIVEPVVRLLAAVPSVIWGLFGLLVLAPFIEKVLISDSLATSYADVVPLRGSNILLGTLVLTIMVAPFEIAIFTDALRAVPEPWRNGARAIGMDRWRTVLKISLPVIRPALVAGTVLATGRAIGEAIALSMVTGALAFVPNPLDGFAFFLEPARPLASSIVDYSEGFDGKVLAQDLFALGALIMISAFALMLAGRIATLGRSGRGAYGF